MTIEVARGRRWNRPIMAGLVCGACLFVVPPLHTDERPTASGSEASAYRPRLRSPESLATYLQHVSPGSDAFPEEKTAEELAARLAELSRGLRDPGRSLRGLADTLLAPDFKGSRLTPLEEVTVAAGPALQLFRAKAMSAEPAYDARTFAGELAALTGELETVQTAEFLVTAIEVGPDPGLARTEVRFDLVGTPREGGRAERVGHWRMQWRRGADGPWRIVQWTTLDQQRSRVPRPIFTEVTGRALGTEASFRTQLSDGVDAWLGAIDSVLTRDAIGHHGVSVGDADGDGLDDLYLAQPAGLPNRLFRARGDGTFEDVTEKAGLAVLDDTAHSIFADIDNDGDQDLLMATGNALLLFANDGRGRFTPVTDAFRFKRGLEGTATSLAVADYDRDGFLDVYLCTYLSFIGASEERTGPPMPYHDARNGPPNVLFRNDGHGRFVDVTEEAGLDEGNDRFSYAAAWGDYDADGWPDLLVANDFGAKNLYHNEGRVSGHVRFREVARAAGAEDYGAGMSAAWLDYDNDGRLDVYTGNMWTAAGQRITAQPAFMPGAPAEVRERYRRHARGNTLLRNRGDGTFEDVTLAARAEMGRWAWSADALDFDGDGWDDLYVVNGMITREDGEPAIDSFFWRQVVARSPPRRLTGTPYDDTWRALNRLLADRSQASHERNVLLRNDGKGGFDEVSGTAGLDLDQDGRSFAVFDYDGDGDPDLVVMAPRSRPQVRLFRNDFPGSGTRLAVRLRGTRSNRDAVGAQVTVETDRLRLSRVVTAGSGFLSQHSKELLFGLGASQRILGMTVRWPSGLVQSFADVPLGSRVRIEEGSTTIQSEPLRTRVDEVPSAGMTSSAPDARVTATGPLDALREARWLYEPFPAPDFTLPNTTGASHSLAALRGHPALIVFWSPSGTASRAVVEALQRQDAALARAGLGLLAVAVAGPGTEEAVISYAILNRYLFRGKAELPLPTAFLLDEDGAIVRVYQGRLEASTVLADARRVRVPMADRLARALPFAGTFYTPPAPRSTYLQYGRELVEQGFLRPALAAFEQAAQGQPSAATLYGLGTLLLKTGQAEKARAAFVRALQVRPDFAEAHNDLGALLAKGGDLRGAIEHFRAALAITPEYPDAMNNLGYALLLGGEEQEARRLYQGALLLQPDFPEALNNLGLIHARQGEMDEAESYFRQAMLERPAYGEAANNLALALVARSEPEIAARLLERLLELRPDDEGTYVTLAKVYLTTDRPAEGMKVLERLLRVDPRHPVALELMRQFKSP